jgi:hypothetical protein
MTVGPLRLERADLDRIVDAPQFLHRLLKVSTESLLRVRGHGRQRVGVAVRRRRRLAPIGRRDGAGCGACGRCQDEWYEVS